MGGCRPTGPLRDEHARILPVLDALEALLDEGPGASREDLRACVAFFRLFADACHHGKEEGVLFPALERRGFARGEGPIAVMLEEHARGRAHVAAMGEALERLAADDPAAWSDLDRAGRAYVDLLRAHIRKEDAALFEMADAALDESECRGLCDAYDVVCARGFEGRTPGELERLGEELARRYRR